ncbi:MAG TPA: hypothetical protein VKZ53_02150 [Candidatus Angelobacter sp.]|nr:hypothetical protein [Candidatus Angelobacter sp.]
MAEKKQKKSFRKRALRFVVSAVYLLYWSYAIEIGATLGILTAAFFPLGIELLGGLYHAGEVPSASEHWARWLLLAGYWMLLLAIALRHVTEAQKQQREKYALAFRLGRLYEFDRTLKSQGKALEIRELLKHIYTMFEPLQIAHVVLHRKADGKISIAHNEVFPETTDAGFLVTLQEGQGVAGSVFKDSISRYVPRIYLPGKGKLFRGVFMPNALTLTFESLNEDSTKEPALENISMDLEILDPPKSGEFLFRSFLSVPVKGPSGECIAVLSLDFKEFNSMKKGDLALANAVGLAIGKIIAAPSGEAGASKQAEAAKSGA